MGVAFSLQQLVCKHIHERTRVFLAAGDCKPAGRRHTRPRQQQLTRGKVKLPAGSKGEAKAYLFDMHGGKLHREWPSRWKLAAVDGGSVGPPRQVPVDGYKGDRGAGASFPAKSRVDEKKFKNYGSLDFGYLESTIYTVTHVVGGIKFRART